MSENIRKHRDYTISPQLLRDLADQLEKDQAYGQYEYRIDHDFYKPVYGNDVELYGKRYQTRYYIDRIINLEIKLIGPTQFRLPNGEWV